MANLGRRPKKALFTIFAVCETVGLCALILHTVVAIFTGGISFDYEESPYPVYNLHALCSVLSLIIMLGNGTMLYRVCRDLRLKTVKYIHMTIMSTSFCLAIFGLIAGIVARESATRLGYRHFYSIHSWLGLTCYIVFLVQILAAYPIFFGKKIRVATEDYFAAIHAFFGICLFVLASFTAAMGISIRGRHVASEYGFWSWQKITLNMAGFLYILFKVLVFYITVNPFYESEQMAEEL